MKSFSAIIRIVPIYLIILLLFIGFMHCSSAIITTLSEQMDEKPTIIIDAGHGGTDGGASTASGVLESHINLSFAIKLNDLCKFVGLRTIMIRSDDRSINTQGETISQIKKSDLNERVRICNNTHNGILISIHQNYYHDARYWGSQVFYANTDRSKDLAEQIQRSICRSLQKDNKRMIKPAKNIYLMENIACTGVLIECGFLSNEYEAYLLQQNTYQNQICSVIIQALSAFLAESCMNLDQESFA